MGVRNLRSIWLHFLREVLLELSLINSLGWPAGIYRAERSFFKIAFLNEKT